MLVKLGNTDIIVTGGSMIGIQAEALVADGQCNAAWALKDAIAKPKLSVECAGGKTKVLSVNFSASGVATGPKCGWAYQKQVSVHWTLNSTPSISISGSTVTNPKVSTGSNGISFSAEANTPLANGKGMHGKRDFSLYIETPTTCVCK